jgi:hypothetical protein
MLPRAGDDRGEQNLIQRRRHAGPRLRFGQDDVRFELKGVRCGLPTILQESRRGPVNERIGLWVLKNSFSGNAQKFHRTRMPYKRLSRLKWTFSVPKSAAVFSESDFFNSHSCSHQLRIVPATGRCPCRRFEEESTQPDHRDGDPGSRSNKSMPSIAYRA